MRLRLRWLGWLAFVLAVTPLAAEAIPSPLEGRTISGTPVAANDPSAVFEYDPNLDLTWLRDWNVNGAQTWSAQVAWAAGLTVGTFGGWSLPSITDTATSDCDFSYSGGTDCGYNVQTASDSTVYSAMAYLWYVELGNLAYCPPGNATCSGSGVPQPGWGLNNVGPFQNMQSYYWSGTEYAPNTTYAWFFNAGNGFQGIGFVKDEAFYAVAVRPGDVAARVPEPQTLALALAGLFALSLARWRRPG